MQKQSLMKRKPKSDVARMFIGVLQLDDHGRPTVLMVPGSDGKQYQVILRRYISMSGYNTITTECRLCAGANGYVNCEGNTYNNICYHSRAAVDFCLSEADKLGSWCQNHKDVLNLNHMKKGNIFKVRSRQSGVEVFVTVNNKVEQLELPM